MQLSRPLLIPRLKINKKRTTLENFLKKDFSYISGKWNSYISRNGTLKPKHEKNSTP